MIQNLDAFIPRLEKMPGQVSVWAEDLETGECFSFQPDVPVVAASVIKLPILISAFRADEEGILSMEEVFCIKAEEKMPSCGVLSYLHRDLRVTMRDLCVLMIIVSDNTATNILIDRIGIPYVNDTMQRMGLFQSKLRRKLFDMKAAEKGIQNHITAKEMGLLLKRLYCGRCVSSGADAQMLSILKDQQLNGKMPFFLGNMDIAHKTGEDDGITHDVGILYGNHPVVLCFTSEHTDVPSFERLMQDMAFAAADGYQ